MFNESSHIEENHLNSNTAGLLFRLVSVQELGEILGYSDVRSVRSWCRQNDIPLFQLGKRTYTDSKLLDLHLEGLITGQQLAKNGVKTKINCDSTEKNMSGAAKKFLSDK